MTQTFYRKPTQKEISEHEHAAQKSVCRFCYHTDTKNDPVIIVYVGDQGDVAQCLDTRTCQERQANKFGERD